MHCTNLRAGWRLAHNLNAYLEVCKVAALEIVWDHQRKTTVKYRRRAHFVQAPTITFAHVSQFSAEKEVGTSPVFYGSSSFCRASADSYVHVAVGRRGTEFLGLVTCMQVEGIYLYCCSCRALVHLSRPQTFSLGQSTTSKTHPP